MAQKSFRKRCYLGWPLNAAGVWLNKKHIPGHSGSRRDNKESCAHGVIDPEFMVQLLTGVYYAM